MAFEERIKGVDRITVRELAKGKNQNKEQVAARASFILEGLLNQESKGCRNSIHGIMKQPNGDISAVYHSYQTGKKIPFTFSKKMLENNISNHMLHGSKRKANIVTRSIGLSPEQSRLPGSEEAVEMISSDLICLHEQINCTPDVMQLSEEYKKVKTPKCSEAFEQKVVQMFERKAEYLLNAPIIKQPKFEPNASNSQLSEKDLENLLTSMKHRQSGFTPTQESLQPSIFLHSNQHTINNSQEYTVLDEVAFGFTAAVSFIFLAKRILGVKPKQVPNNNDNNLKLPTNHQQTKRKSIT